MDTFAHRHSEQLLIFCVAALIGLGVCTGAAQAANEAAAQEQRPINIDVRDMAISDVLRMLGQAANVNIIVGQGVTANVQSLTLRNVSVEAALRLITEAHGYYWRLDDNVYVVSATPGPARQGAGDAAPEPRAVEEAEGQPPREADTRVPPPPMPDEPGYGSVTPEPSRPGAPETITVFIQLRYANAYEIALMFGGSGGDQGMLRLQSSRLPGGISLRSASGTKGHLLGPSMRTPGRARGGTALAQFEDDAGGAEGPLGRGLTGTTTGQRGTTGGAGAGADLLPDGMEPPLAIMRDNALLVRGTPSAIDEFREILAMLDTPPKQVEIATKWVEVTTTAAKALGIDWAVSNGALEFWNLGFAPGEAGNNGIRYARGRFWAELAALENTGQAMVINEPRIICMNGMMGIIEFFTEIPFFSAMISYNQFGQRTVEFEAQFISISNMLQVTPQINADDSIEMYLMPQLEDQVGTVEGPNGERIPIITSQYVETMVRVHDGETFVLGGVIRKDESVNLRKTPLLADIPIIGKLFQSKRTETTSTELLIFVTPRIIRDMTTE